MARGLDLTNEKFGKLTALHLHPTRKENKLRMWVCLCECGNTKIVPTKFLRSGMTSTCGCGAHPNKKSNSNWKGFGEIPLDFYTTVKRNAESRSIKFEVSIEYLWDLFLKQQRKCALSDLPIQFGRTNKDRINTTVSVDRIDSKKGYVKGNVQWVHKKINIMKNVYTQEEFIELCKLVYKKIK